MAIELTTANNAVLSQIQRYTATGILYSVFPNISKVSFSYISGTLNVSSPTFSEYGGVMDCQALDRCRIVQVGGGTTNGSINVTTISNASVLTQLEDIGTQRAWQLQATRLSADTLNTVFTDLPSTTVTATLDIRYTNGVASCNTAIATSKGYTVVT